MKVVVLRHVMCGLFVGLLLTGTTFAAQTNGQATKQTSRQALDPSIGKLPMAATTKALTAADCRALGGFVLSDSLNVCPSKMVCKTWSDDRRMRQVCLEAAK
ncbi:MAG: hypothetical protein ACK4MS_14485 [Paracoccaceae bacterium]